MVKITINGREIEVAEGLNLIEAARTIGVEVPHFCYHPGLRIVGQCRICLVEVEGIPKLQPACSEKVRDGLIIHTDNERVKKLRAQVMEFLLINHPLDCPVCDQAGECDLQDTCEAHSFTNSRFSEEKHTFPGFERRAIGPHVFQNQNRCIHCSRCIRVTQEIAETGELTFAQRGYHMLVDTKEGRPLDNPWSACVADACPVGALTVRDFRFKERVWNLESSPSICPHCGNGCNILLEHKQGVTRRILPRENPDVNSFWLCDFGRFSYDWMNSAELFEPYLSGEESSWNEALGSVGEEISKGAPSLALITPFQTNEEIALLKGLFDRVMLVVREGEEQKIKNGEREWLASTNPGPNSRGAEMQSVDRFTAIPEDTRLLFIADNPFPLPTLEVMGCEIAEDIFVIADTRRDGALAKRADIVLPGALFPEKEGTYLNDHNYLQHVDASMPIALGARTILDYGSEILKALEKDRFGETPEEIFVSIEKFKKLTYSKLPTFLEDDNG